MTAAIPIPIDTIPPATAILCPLGAKTIGASSASLSFFV